MKYIKGKFNLAVVYTNVIEDGAINQIRELCDSVEFRNSKIRIMPDVHEGASCTIGTTMTITDKVIPNMVGVDIGCGVEVVQIAEKQLDFATLDKFIYEHVPSGPSIRAFPHPYAKKTNIDSLLCKHNVGLKRGELSVGTLGGGNHFIEVDKDEDGNLYLVVHSGSRHLGLEVATHYQTAAKMYHTVGKWSYRELIAEMKAQGRETEIQTEIEKLKTALENQKKDEISSSFIEGELMQNYLHDMGIMQEFADLNRKAIVDTILSGLNLTEVDRFTTTHNYFYLQLMFLRKGAVSAKKGEKLLIPINMKEGSLICIGKGNPAWNKSAPHGAGRLLSRNRAFKELSLDQFTKEMEGIYSSTVNASTLDESPMAYKSLSDIVDNIATTVSVVKRIVPVYNFKATDTKTDYRKKRK